MKGVLASRAITWLPDFSSFNAETAAVTSSVDSEVPSARASYNSLHHVRVALAPRLFLLYLEQSEQVYAPANATGLTPTINVRQSLAFRSGFPDSWADIHSFNNF